MVLKDRHYLLYILGSKLKICQSPKVIKLVDGKTSTLIYVCVTLNLTVFQYSEISPLEETLVLCNLVEG